MSTARRRITASGDVTRMLLQHASSMGLDAERIARAAGLAPSMLAGPQARVPLEQFNTIWSEIARQAGDPTFGLHLGETAPELAGGHILFAVMMSCPTLGEALDRFSRYHGLLADFARPCLHLEAGHARLTWEPAYPSLALQRQHAEAILSMIASLLRRLTAGKVTLLQVRFRHPEPADTREHRRVFRCPVSFAQPRSELLIRREDLSLPIVLANPELLQSLDPIAQDLMERSCGADTWADRVTQSIGRQLLRGESPRLEATAAEMAIGGRQLQNRLRDQGTTYRQLLDQVRKGIALDLLKRADVSIHDVAFLVGFSQQSTFTHAFRRWTGLSPGEYRRQAGASNGGPAARGRLQDPIKGGARTRPDGVER
jgi:AraC-like DNA-binding protein